MRGINPLTTHGGLFADIVSGSFGGNAALERYDFQAPATANQVAIMSVPVTGERISSGSLSAAGLAAINKTGIAQLRLYFSLDDDGDKTSDYVGCYSGDAANASNRPKLEVAYRLW